MLITHAALQSHSTHGLSLKICIRVSAADCSWTFFTVFFWAHKISVNLSGRESAACRIASRHNHYMVVLCGLAADSGQCTQRASTAGLQNGQARNLRPSLNLSLSLFSGWISVSQERVLLTLYLDYTLGLLRCRAVFPKDLEWTTPWGSLLEGCFQTQQGITASSSFLQIRKKTRHALNTAIAVLPTGQVLSQPTPTDWTRSAAHFCHKWLQHLSGVTNQTGAFCFSQACSEDVFNLSKNKLMIPIVLFHSLWMFFFYGWCSPATWTVELR